MVVFAAIAFIQSYVFLFEESMIDSKALNAVEIETVYLHKSPAPCNFEYLSQSSFIITKLKLILPTYNPNLSFDVSELSN